MFPESGHQRSSLAGRLSGPLWLFAIATAVVSLKRNADTGNALSLAYLAVLGVALIHRILLMFQMPTTSRPWLGILILGQLAAMLLLVRGMPMEDELSIWGLLIVIAGPMVLSILGAIGAWASLIYRDHLGRPEANIGRFAFNAVVCMTSFVVGARALATNMVAVHDTRQVVLAAWQPRQPGLHQGTPQMAAATPLPQALALPPTLKRPSQPKKTPPTAPGDPAAAAPPASAASETDPATILGKWRTAIEQGQDVETLRLAYERYLFTGKYQDEDLDEYLRLLCSKRMFSEATGVTERMMEYRRTALIERWHGYLLMMEDRLGEAITTYQALCKRSEALPQDATTLIDMAQRANAHAVTLEACQQLLKKGVSDSKTLSIMGRALIRMGEVQKGNALVVEAEHKKQTESAQ
jgi:hypothetical protein